MKSSPSIKDLQKLPHLHQVRFAVFCAKQVLHLASQKDKAVCVKAIETAELFVAGEATSEECKVAANAAYSAAHAAANAAYSAAHAAAHAAYAAAYAAYASSEETKQTTIKEQWEVYNDLLNVTESLEKAIGLTC